MNPVLRNIVAVISGVVVCMLVNGGIIALSASIIPPPEGMNVEDMESIKANAHLFEPKHFIMPFLAHALGSLFGAFVTAKIATSRKMTLALIVGTVHLAGGIAASFMIPAPAWFVALDLIAAYIPMAWLGGKLGGQATRK